MNKAAIQEESQENPLCFLEENQGKINNLLNEYPCIQLKTQFRGFENRLVEVIFNENFLQITGYTIDSFISIVLREGLPRYLFS